MTGKDKEPVIKHYGWIVKHTKNGKTLRHLKVDGKKIDFLGVEWSSLSAFAWVSKDDAYTVIPHFNKQSAKEMANLYKAQTGDMAVTVEMVEIL
jgi:hypothetical protein